MNIIWSDTAKIQLWKIVDYLYDKWTEKEVLNFRDNVDNLTKSISKNTELCPQSKIHNLRKCLINKQNSLVYLFQNKTIYIVALIDNRSENPY